jgi:sugar lactone lactonase YvrE
MTHRASNRSRSSSLTTLAGLMSFAGLMAAPALSQAQVVAGDSASVQVLLDGGVLNPTTVAVRDNVAFLVEGQLSLIGQVANPFQVVTVALDGTGLLPDTVQLPGADFFPEGIALDANTNDLFVGSLVTGSLVKVPSGTFTAEEFAAPAPAVLARGAVGLEVNEVNNVVFVCDSNPNLAGATLTGLNLADASVAVTHEFPGANDFCNDVTFDAAGNLFVTESATGQVFTIDAANVLTPNSLELLVATPGIAPQAEGGVGANGIAFASGGLFVANTDAGTIVRFDPAAADVAATETIVNVSEDNAANTLLSGPDGITPLSETELLVVENGLAGALQNRLVKLTLDPIVQQ